MDALQSIAQVAIALAGFGGIAAGLGYRARGVWSEEDQTRLLGMTISSLIVVFACFVPSAVEHMGSSAPWRISGIPLLVVLVPTCAFSGHALVRRLRAGGLVPGGYSRLAGSLGMVAQILAIFLLSVLSLGRAAPHELGFYLSSVLFILFLASTLFVRLLIASFRKEDDSAP